jgi:anti-sigma factor ChrR (cupin superfamily)
MTCLDVQPLLSEYLDGSLPGDTSDAVSAHVAACPSCHALVADLERIRATARALGPVDPPAHLWMEIAGRLRLDAHTPAAPRPPRRQSLSLSLSRPESRQWLGLAAALVIVTIGVYAATRPDAAPESPVSVVAGGNASEMPTVETISDTWRRVEASYEQPIQELEAMVKSGEDPASDAALEILQRNVTLIDSAIAESRAALTDDPASQPARTSLFEALGHKVSLLQQTVVLMNEMRQGDAGGAAEAAAGIKTRTDS